LLYGEGEKCVVLKNNQSFVFALVLKEYRDSFVLAFKFIGTSRSKYLSIALRYAAYKMVAVVIEGVIIVITMAKR